MINSNGDAIVTKKAMVRPGLYLSKELYDQVADLTYGANFGEGASWNAVAVELIKLGLAYKGIEPCQ